MAKQPQLLDHQYDGIQEWDNPTPGWWHLLFIGSVAFSIVYAVFWHSSPISWTKFEQHERDKQSFYAILFKDLGELAPDEPTMLRLMQDEKWMSFGSSIFAANCAQCHGADGAGINGANLTDDRYINVKALPDLYKIVTEGVTAKGMPEWKNRLGQNERILVASYVANLRGSNKTGRAPEGEVIAPWPPASAGGAPAGASLP